MVLGEQSCSTQLVQICRHSLENEIIMLLITNSLMFDKSFTLWSKFGLKNGHVQIFWIVAKAGTGRSCLNFKCTRKTCTLQQRERERERERERDRDRDRQTDRQTDSLCLFFVCECVCVDNFVVSVLPGEKKSNMIEPCG